MKNNKGVSLIALIITIAVLVIIAGAVIQKGMSRTDDAKIAEHNHSISVTQEEIESYYYYQGGILPVVNLTPYPIPTGTNLEREIIKNSEQNDTFYTVDLSKLGKVAGKDGTTGGNDVYIVSSVRHTVYYAKGDTIKGITYNGLITNSNVSLAQAGDAPLANSPKLATGMIPIKWSGNTMVDLNATEKQNMSNEWYDYQRTGATANKWANVRLKDGSIFVWIPRYTYKILSGEHSSTAGNISIRFSKGTTDDTSDGYRVHPAFYWGGWDIPIAPTEMTKQGGGTELTGIWVGKFEPSYVSAKIKIAPNLTCFTGGTIGGFFTFANNMNGDTATYGTSTDSDMHMIKNSEWGAVTYLAHYALGGANIPGSNATNKTADSDMSANKTLSTTGNEYGVYDMQGGSEEYVAAYVNNNHTNLTTYGNALCIAQPKYKDLLPKASSDSADNNYAAASKAYGMALYETSSAGSNPSTSAWFSNQSLFPTGFSPFFTRNTMFYFRSTHGDGYSYMGFRVACVAP